MYCTCRILNLRGENWRASACGVSQNPNIMLQGDLCELVGRAAHDSQRSALQERRGLDIFFGRLVGDLAWHCFGLLIVNVPALTLRDGILEFRRI